MICSGWNLLWTVSNCWLCSGYEHSGSETRVFISLRLALMESEQAYRVCSFVVHLLALSATQTIFRRMITCWWIRNWEGCGGKRSWPIISYFPVFAWRTENWGKPSETSVRLYGEPEAPRWEANVQHLRLCHDHYDSSKRFARSESLILRRLINQSVIYNSRRLYAVAKSQ
jgi:hypothetical protein